jgi:integrase
MKTELAELAAEQNLVGDTIPRALTDRAVSGAKKSLPDGGGLGLVVSKTGTKSWQYRYKIDGRPGNLTLGQYPEISLAEARQMHRAARWLVARGIVPLAWVKERQAEKTAAKARAAAGSFRAICEAWQEDTSRAISARTYKHRREMLATHVLPTIGDRQIETIRRGELVELLAQIDKKTPVTARHCRGYLNQIFEYAADRELIDNSPVPSKKVLVNANSRTEKPRLALPMAEIGEFLNSLKTTGETIWQTKAAFEFMILTWTRTNEAIAARVEEFDLDAGTWTIQGGRMKAGKEHVVYLSKQALAIAREAIGRMSDDPRKAGYLFPVWRRTAKAGHINRMTFNAWLVRHGWSKRCDVHGFRATASTWANDSGKHRGDVIEAALAHSQGDKVRAAYNRAQYEKELRKLWQSWADEIEGRESKWGFESSGGRRR